MGIEKVGIDSNFQVPFAFEKAFFYPLVGYYLEHNININKIKKKPVLLARSSNNALSPT